ncbi:MAG: DNA replication protein DnaC [bacterium ADurb.Bin478]|nr:MAG: DNA replication protein DnaC [bacterium ADurb.Bin478]
MSKENMATSSSTEPEEISRGFIGDPNCPICGGVGFIRRDLPVGHPDFGRLEICTCRQREVARSETQRLYRLSNLEAFQGMTFDTFKVQGRLGLGEAQIKSLNFAYNQAQHFAKNLQGWMFFLGPYGCGKTHLAAAIANFAVAVGVPTLFLTVPDLLDWLRFSFGSSDYGLEERLEEIRSIQLLVLDDLGTQNTTPWAAEKLYQIINHRYTHRLSTVLTTNLSLNDIDGRISSRLQDPDLVTQVEISAPDYRSPVNDEGHSPISSLVLLSDRTFGSFSLREYEKLNPEDKQSLQKAFKAATQFSEDPSGWLVLMGGYGSGKTHLAAAIGNYRKALGEEPIFVVVPDLLDHLRAAFNPNSPVSYDRRFEAVRTAPLLILDDLGTQSATPWAREKLYQILNYRYNAHLPTVITTAQSLKEIDERVRSRMLDKRLCTIYAITAPAYMASPQPKRRSSSKQTN